MEGIIKLTQQSPRFKSSWEGLAFSKSSEVLAGSGWDVPVIVKQFWSGMEKSCLAVSPRDSTASFLLLYAKPPKTAASSFVP